MVNPAAATVHLEKQRGEQVRQPQDKAQNTCASMWGSMANWFTFLLRGCKRRRRPRAVRVLDPENEHHDSGFRRPHRRTYYYSMFSVRLAIMVRLTSTANLFLKALDTGKPINCTYPRASKLSYWFAVKLVSWS
jgi:hypothetical protein